MGLVRALVFALAELLDLLGERVHLAAALAEKDLEHTLGLGLQLLGGLLDAAHQVHHLGVLDLLALIDLANVVRELLQLFRNLAGELLCQGDALGD
jgi:hypothetical protein